MKQTELEVQQKYRARTWIMAKWGIVLAILTIVAEVIIRIVAPESPGLPVAEILLFCGALTTPMGLKSGIKEWNRPKMEGNGNGS